jgi:hypothetical protein
MHGSLPLPELPSLDECGALLIHIEDISTPSFVRILSLNFRELFGAWVEETVDFYISMCYHVTHETETSL